MNVLRQRHEINNIAVLAVVFDKARAKLRLRAKCVVFEETLRELCMQPVLTELFFARNWCTPIGSLVWDFLTKVAVTPRGFVGFLLGTRWGYTSLLILAHYNISKFQKA